MKFRPLWCAAALALVAVAAANVAAAKPWWAKGNTSNDGDFLPPDLAFKPSVRLDGSLLRIRWIIADGYYLYRNKFEVKAESPDLEVAAATFPPGVAKTDPYLGAQEVYYQQVEATVAYSRVDAGAHPLQIKVTYQGCADAGLCYLPITKVIFPGSSTAALPVQSHPWEFWAIGGGALAFLMAGFMLRKGRRSPMPAL